LSRPEAAVDHLLLGVADLDRGVAWVEKLTGVRAMSGGSHPGVGTRNALLSLGARRYLEIIATDPAQSTYAFPVDIRGLDEPRLVTWAVATTDLDKVVALARPAGFAPSAPQPGSRQRPDGKVLRWKLVRLENNFARDGVQPFPFFITWIGDTPHPAADSPPGCELASITIEHPEAVDLAAALRRFGIEADVKQSARTALIAEVRTPKGDVVLK